MSQVQLMEMNLLGMSSRGRIHRSVLKGRFSLHLYLMLLVCLLLLPLHVNAQAFGTRHTFDVRGDMALAGNALLTCSTSGTGGTGCAAHRENNIGSITGNGNVNGNRNMEFINIDPVGLPGTAPKNSSTARLDIPMGAKVLSAGLYWGGRNGSRSSPSSAGINTLYLKGPGGSYEAITSPAGEHHRLGIEASNDAYIAYADVTDVIKLRGAGNYSAGGLTAATGNGGSLGHYGGWALVVLYELQSKPFRRLALFDGQVANGGVGGGNGLTVDINGLQTPVTGSFTTYLGALVWEGDAGLAGDGIRLNTTDVSDSASPSNNFWNSGISFKGSNVLNRTPSYLNNMAMDLKYVDASNILLNNATTAKVEFFTASDTYIPHALVFITDLHFPDLVTSLKKDAYKGGVKLNPNDPVDVGEEIEYRVSFTNSGKDGATKVTVIDEMPAGTQFVPGSMTIITNVTGAPTGPVSDALDSDTGDFSSNKVNVKLGKTVGADDYVVLPGESAEISFKVKIVEAGMPVDRRIQNNALVTHNAQTIKQTYDAVGNAETNIIGPVSAGSVSFTKVAALPGGATTVSLNDLIEYTLTVNVAGLATTADVVLLDTLGAGLDFDSVTQTGVFTADTVSNPLKFTLPSGQAIGSYTVKYTAKVNSTAVTNVKNTVVSSTATCDPVGSCEVETPVTQVPDFTLLKSAALADSNGNTVVGDAGDEITYSFSATNTGTVDLTNVVVSDVNLPTLVCTIATLAVGDTASCIPSNNVYTITPADVTAGKVTNIATATATPPGTLTPPTPSSPPVDTPTAGTPVADFTLLKSAALADTNGNTVVGDAGDEITYSFSATNTGTVDLTNVVVSDVNLPTLVCTIATLVVGDTASCIPSNNVYTITPADVTAGKVTNIATATATPPGTLTPPTPSSPPVDTPTAGTPVADFTLLKSAALADTNGNTVIGDVGDEITYSFSATNTGTVDLTNVVVSDVKLPGLVCTVATLVVGDTASCIPSNNVYTITPADVTAGKVTNIATATATPPGTLTPPTPSSPPVDTPTAGTPVADFTLSKSAALADSNGNTVVGDAGDEITYSFSATNTGTVDLTNVVVSDVNLPTLVCTIATLAVGDTASCIPSNNVYTITPADVTAGKVTNIATATATPPGTLTPPTPSSPPVDTPTAGTPVADFTLLKSAALADSNGNTVIGDAGDEITYSFSATNTGTVDLTNVVVSDVNLPTLVCTIATLAVGDTASCIPSNNVYTITPADVTAGKVTNIATATATPPGTLTPPTPSSPPVDTPTAGTPVADFTLLKSAALADSNGNTVIGDAGDEITYSFSATNTGTVDLTNVVVSDVNLPTLVCTIATLAVGDTASCIPSNNVYTITPADVTAGKVTNIATATATPPGTLTPPTPSSPPVDTPTAGTPVADFTLLKSAALADTNGNTVVGDVGDEITYSFSATNTGTVDLTNVVVSDVKLPGLVCTVATLVVGDTASCIPSNNVYTITPADVTAGKVTNIATATATPPGTLTPPTPSSPPVDTPTAGTPVADFTLLKSAALADSNGNTVIGDVGDEITYSFSATNTGTVDLTNVVVSDVNLPGLVCTVATLAVGDTVSCIPSNNVYTITPADVTAGKVTNIATATATPPGTLTPPTPSSPPVDTPTAGTPVADFTLLKSAALADSNGNTVVGDAGDEITYSFSATNTGTVDLTNVVVSDVKLPGLVCTVATLAVGDTASCIPSNNVYTITPADVTAGKVTNIATATATPPGTLTPPTPSSPPVDTPTAGTPVADFTLLKSAALADSNGNTVVGDAGDEITYSFSATNTGTVDLTNVVVSDVKLPGLVCTVATLAVGDTASCIPSNNVYTITPADVTAGKVTNIATATATPPGTLTPPTPSSPPVVTVTQLPAIDAINDNFGPINGVSGSVNVGNVLDNDTLNGVAVVPANVTTTVIGSVPVELTFNPATGVVGVQPNTPAGSYSFDYQICDKLNPTNCDTATAIVTVNASAIDAVNDNFGLANGVGGSVNVGNVLGNDTLNGVAVVPANVTTTVIGSVPAELTFNPATGVVGVQPNTPAGSYSFDYQICDKLNPANCDTATVIVTVNASAIDAVNDNFGLANGVGGSVNVGNVLGNDTLNGVAVVPANVTTTVIGSVPVELTFNPVTGVVGVQPNTPAGSYSFDYQFCDKLNPANCDTATATVTVGASVIDAANDSFGPVNGGGLSNVGNVLDNDTLNGVAVNLTNVTTTVIGIVPAELTFNPATGVVGVKPNTPAGSYSFDYQICDKLNPANCDTATATVTVNPPVIDAVTDSFGPVIGTDGSSNVGNVLDNDTLNGTPVNPSQINTTVVGTVPAELTFDPATGVVGVKPNTPAGDYSFDYQICDRLNPSNCDTATVVVTVTAPVIDAVEDNYGPVDGITGVTLPPVFDNDTLNGKPVNPADIDTTVVGSVPSELLFDTATGVITVQPNTPAGDYSFQYQICDKLNPTNCDIATVTVNVPMPLIVAVDDVYEPITGGDGNTNVGNIFGNDTLGGRPFQANEVNTTVLGEMPQGLTFDPVTGVIGILPNTPSGDYSFQYQICDTRNANNCDTATVTIPVKNDSLPLLLVKQATPQEVKIGDLVRYTLTIKNTSSIDVVDSVLLDTPPAGFSYVDKSLAVTGAGANTRINGISPMRVEGLNLKTGTTATITYFLRVGAGAAARGEYINTAQMLLNGKAVSNQARASVRRSADPLFEDSRIWGTVFHDRDGDGWQDSATANGIKVSGGFAADAYVANSTTVDRGNGPQPEPDASSPLLHGIALGELRGRRSPAEPESARTVVISQLLTEAKFNNDFSLTTKEGMTLRMDAQGHVTTEKAGDAKRQLTAQNLRIERNSYAAENGLTRVDYIITNTGIDERGVPGVRIGTVEGLLIETDAYGRFHLEGIDVSHIGRGRNFIMKVDDSTLPPGSRFTTKNPEVKRITQGLPTRFDFGVQLPETVIKGAADVELELGEVLFEADSAEIRPEYNTAIETIATQLNQHGGGVLRLVGHAEQESLALRRAEALRNALLEVVDKKHHQAIEVVLGTELQAPLSLDAQAIVLGEVLFVTDEAEVRGQYRQLMQELAAVIRQRLAAGQHIQGIELVGHADRRGSQAYNHALGERRARAVFAAIATHLTAEERARLRVNMAASQTVKGGARP